MSVPPPSPTHDDVSPVYSPFCSDVTDDAAQSSSAIPSHSAEQSFRPLSFNALLQRESLQAIEIETQQLLRIIRHMPTRHGGKDGPKRLRTNDLRAFSRLSENIAASVSKVAKIRKQQTTKRTHDQTSSQGSSPEELLSGSERPTSAQGGITCRNCHTSDTPRWRRGPDGPCTLCNVCGLVYAKRRHRLAE